MTHAPRALAALLVALLATTACDNTLGPKPSQTIFADTIVVASLNGTPPAAPAGLNLLGGYATTVNATFNFQLAFDILSNGQVVVYPVQKVANALTSAGRVGIQRVGAGTTFESISHAPGSGYQFDSTFAVAVNAPIVVEVSDPLVCTSILVAQVYYAKIAVLSADPVTRSIKVAATVDPNCSYRTLAPTGIVPKD